MDGRARILTATLTVVLVLTAMIAAGSAQTAPPAVKDACALLTNEEVGTAAGTTVRSSRPRSVPGGSECVYQTRAGFGLTIVVSGPVDPKDFDELRGLFGSEAEPVSGVGDTAYFLLNDRIYVRVGRQQFVASRGSKADAKFRDVLLAIAKFAVSRMR